MMTESQAKPKAKRTSRASKPRKSATSSKSPPKGGAKAKLVYCHSSIFGCHGQRPEEVGRVNGELMGLVQ
jgi:hypothetical protein